MDNLMYREATLQDEGLYFSWVNDQLVRKNSFNQNTVTKEEHHQWFKKNLENKDNLLLIFFNSADIPVGQVRMDNKDTIQINISIDESFRGGKYSAKMIRAAINEYRERHGTVDVFALVKKENIPSVKAFDGVGYKRKENLKTKDCLQYVF